MATILDGRALSKKIKNHLKAEIEGFVAKGMRKPCLATIMVGADPGSQVYVRNKDKACNAVGIEAKSFDLPEDTTQEKVLEIIAELNADETVDAILVQSPLPKHISEQEVIEAIDPKKDADGFHPLNAGMLSKGSFGGMVPCTPLGVWILLKHYNIETRGADVCMVGASNIVGKPMTLILLINEEATVTVCHINTKDLKANTLRADIVIVAVGKPNLIKPDMVKEGGVVVDVGINRVEGKTVGDADYDGLLPKVSAISPVPGGAGSMTVAVLLMNTMNSYRQSHGMEKIDPTEFALQLQ